MPDPSLTEIIVVLDRSGSMASCASDMRGGFDTLIAEQRKVPGRCDVTLVQFDEPPGWGLPKVNRIETVYDARPIAEVPPLVLEPRGGTPLLDAVATTIDRVGARLKATPEAARPGQVVMIIITDGQENSSVEFKLSDVKKRVEHQTKEYNWQFMFLGANVDAFSEASGMGIMRGSTTGYVQTAGGIGSTFTNTSKKLASYRTSGDKGALHFTDEERAENNDVESDEV